MDRAQRVGVGGEPRLVAGSAFGLELSDRLDAGCARASVRASHQSFRQLAKQISHPADTGSDDALHGGRVRRERRPATRVGWPDLDVSVCDWWLSADSPSLAGGRLFRRGVTCFPPPPRPFPCPPTLPPLLSFPAFYLHS